MTSESLHTTPNPATKKEDDWAPDIKQPLLLKMPSFIRLFVMRRILENYSGTTDTLLNESNIDKSMHDTAKDILCLLRNTCLKIYMEKHYNENKQAEIIEMIFNQIMLKKFAKEYQNVAKYTSSSKNKNKQKKNEDESKHYQTLLFNTTDVMCLMFQFLVDFDEGGQYIGEISNCSVVCSHWLYHTFNPKSAYYLRLSTIASATANSDYNIDRNVTRAWQRLWNVREVYFDSLDIDERYLIKTSNLLLNKLSMLRNVEKIGCESDFRMEHFITMKLILQNCKEKICVYTIDVSDHDQNVLSPLILNNAQHIYTNHTYFSIIWSNKFKLQSLNLASLKNLNDQWCNLVINECDCSGILHLSIHDLTFDN